MKGMLMMLKALGVTISEDDIKKLEEFLPQLPQRIVLAWQIIEKAMMHYDQQLTQLKLDNQDLKQALAEIKALLEVREELTTHGSTTRTTKRINGRTTQ